MESYGGPPALARTKVVRQTGRTVSMMRGGVEGAVLRVIERPDRLRIEIDYPGTAKEIRVLDGAQAWTGGGPAPPMMRAAMLLQAARLSLPGLLWDRKTAVKDHGKRPGGNGATVRTLEIPLATQLSLFVGIDMGSARILSSSGVISAGDGRTMEFSTKYDDFRVWDGVLVPTREEQFAMGHYIGRTVIESVEMLSAADPGAFRP